MKTKKIKNGTYINDWLETEHYVDGKLHRVDGPAVVVDEDHPQCGQWYFNGKRHREDGPAWLTDDDTELWYWHGKKHRENGPAIVHPNGWGVEWWLHGVKMGKNEKGFWRFWDALSDEKRNCVELHMWMAKYAGVTTFDLE